MDSAEFFSNLEAIPLPQFGGYFYNFMKTAFRLEMLPQYNVPEESESFALFLSGSSAVPENFNNDWRELIAKAVSQGKRFSRIRLIEGPLTLYQQFEISWAYKKSVEVGEDIRFIVRPEKVIFKKAVPALKDFWLFDGKDCLLMEYDQHGSFLGVKRVPERFTSSYVDLMKEALNLSAPFEETVKRLNL